MELSISLFKVEEAGVTNVKKKKKKESFLKNRYTSSIQQERASSFVFSSRPRMSNKKCEEGDFSEKATGDEASSSSCLSVRARGCLGGGGHWGWGRCHPWGRSSTVTLLRRG